MTAKSLSKLPRTDEVWEIGMIHAEHHAGGVDLVGLLIAVERTTGTIRAAEALARGESPAIVLREAFVQPRPPARPARPTRVVVDDPALQHAVADLLAEARVPSVTGATPAVDDAFARLLGQAGAPPAPGLDHAAAAAWRPALSALIRVAPWTRIDDRVAFTFRGAGLDGSVAIVMGADRIPGVLLHPSVADLERHRSETGSGAARTSTSVHLMLEPRSGLSNEDIDRCCRSGLQFPPGLYPRVYAVVSGTARLADAAEQDQLLRAVQAITALCERHLADLAAGRSRSVGVPASGVEVTGLVRGEA